VDNTPPNTEIGDLLLAIISIETCTSGTCPASPPNASTGTISTPTGWTELTQSVATAGTDLQVRLFIKVANSVDSNSGMGGNTYTWNFSGTYLASAMMENFSQIGITPVEGGPNCQAATSSTSIVAPSLTTGKANDLNVPVWVSASHQIPSAPAAYSGGFEPGTAPTGFGPLASFSSLGISLSGTMTGNQTATIGVGADNIGCQLDLSSRP